MTRLGLGLALILTALASHALAQPALKGPLAGLAFLTGEWSSGEGKVAATGQTSIGTSSFAVEADGGALLRRDSTQLTDPDGKPAGGFSQIMLIHAEGAGLAAEYVDGGGHVIHYDKVTVKPGRSVAFSSASGEGGQPAYRLVYELKGPNDLKVDFGMMPPGSSAVRPIASGVLHRTR